MRQTARVTALLPQERAEVAVERKSACSGDCHQCAGCGAVKQMVRVVAENPIHAQPGELVCIESGGGTVLRAAALVYLLPLALFLAAYLAAQALASGGAGWWGLAGFALGLVPAFLYDRHVRRRPPVYRIVERVS